MGYVPAFFTPPRIFAAATRVFTHHLCGLHPLIRLPLPRLALKHDWDGQMKPELSAGTYPLSPMQQGMLFHNLSARKPGVDVEQIF